MVVKEMTMNVDMVVLAQKAQRVLVTKSKVCVLLIVPVMIIVNVPMTVRRQPLLILQKIEIVVIMSVNSNVTLKKVTVGNNVMVLQKIKETVVLIIVIISKQRMLNLVQITVIASVLMTKLTLMTV